MPLLLATIVRTVAQAARRVIVIAVAGGAFLLAGSTIAFAHVTVSPPTATAGSYATLTFKVPTESADASTVGLTVTLPTDHPIPSVSARSAPGWAVDMTKVTLDPPVTEGGFTLDHAVHTVTWAAQNGPGIKPGEFAEFALSVGPLPDAGRLVFPAKQIYSDGTIVKWDEVADSDDDGAEPEHPAPTVTVVAAGDSVEGATAGSGSGDSATDTTAQVLGLAALILAAIALAVAVAGTRRRPSPAGARPVPDAAPGAAPLGGTRAHAAPPEEAATGAAPDAASSDAASRDDGPDRDPA